MNPHENRQYKFDWFDAICKRLDGISRQQVWDTLWRFAQISMPTPERPCVCPPCRRKHK